MTKTENTPRNTMPSGPAGGLPQIGAAALLQGEGAPGDGEAGALLEAFVARRRAEGWTVAGLIQRRDSGDGLRHLVDLDGGQSYAITQELGSGSESCVVDPHGVAAASVVLRRAVDASADILVINKFGRLESEGEGLVDETLAAMAAGLIVLTTVHENYREAFWERTGGLATLLPCTQDALEAWWLSLLVDGAACADGD
jgi:nucleoside-triphosphatase THEP1